jgi:pSer/pThr/pTyr-binding forkhead associated (FHA) protein
MAEDMDSTNGTLVNGQKLAPRQPHPLHDGDTIQLGKLILRYSEF